MFSPSSFSVIFYLHSMFLCLSVCIQHIIAAHIQTEKMKKENICTHWHPCSQSVSQSYAYIRICTHGRTRTPQIQRHCCCRCRSRRCRRHHHLYPLLNGTLTHVDLPHRFLSSHSQTMHGWMCLICTRIHNPIRTFPNSHFLFAQQYTRTNIYLCVCVYRLAFSLVHALYLYLSLARCVCVRMHVCMLWMINHQYGS